MIAFKKLFSSQSAGRNLKGPLTLAALMVAAVIFSPGCDCGGSGDGISGLPKAPQFLSLNVADGIPSAHTRVSFPPIPVMENIATDAVTGTATPIVSRGAASRDEFINAIYGLSVTGSDTLIDDYSARAYALNLTVVMGTNAAPLIRNIGMPPVVTPNVIVMQADHTIGDIDIYVTAPGTNLATVGPDAAGRAYANYTMMNAIHTGATFQVQATLAGTKTVVADFGTTTTAKERTSYVFVMAEVGGAKMLRNLEFPQD